MREINQFPKSVKKAIRYIRQDASIEQLRNLEVYLSREIHKRTNDLKEQEKTLN